VAAASFRPPSLEEKEAYVRALFDQIAEQYDATNQLMSLGQWERWHREFVRYTGLKPGMQNLDVACGTGDLTLLAAAQVAPDGQVVGIDFSDGMLAVGRRRVEASPYRHLIRLEWGNAMSLQFDDGRFDCVTIGWAMRNVKEIRTVLQEMYRVLKPGGRVVCLEAARPQNPVVRAGFFFVWKTLIPLIDWVIVKVGRQAKVRPYTYLSRSLDTFPGPDELERQFRETGFVRTGWRGLMLGTVAIHYGVKPS
jgi:demethylmenaquinone methyltransferase / 2-methoxy-6-polyprenyl-1,4-benzoquinol methylase